MVAAQNILDDEHLYDVVGSNQRYANRFSVDLRDLPYNLETYSAYLSLWLKRNCVKNFRVEIYGYPLYKQRHEMLLYFEDKNDAMLFKLKSQLPLTPA